MPLYKASVCFSESEMGIVRNLYGKWTAFVQYVYERSLVYASNPKALWILAAFSFAESSFFPIPPDILLIPMILSAPEKAYRDAGVCTLSSVVGGFFGYAIGMFLYEAVALPVFTFYNYTEQLESFKQYYNTYGAWVVAMAGFTPFPYKVITITSGMTGLDLGVFALASVLSRGGRFFLLAFLLKKWGMPMKVFLEKNLGWLATLFFLLLFGGFCLLKAF